MVQVWLLHRCAPKVNRAGRHIGPGGFAGVELMSGGKLNVDVALELLPALRQVTGSTEQEVIDAQVKLVDAFSTRPTPVAKPVLGRYDFDLDLTMGYVATFAKSFGLTGSDFKGQVDDAVTLLKAFYAAGLQRLEAGNTQSEGR